MSSEECFVVTRTIAATPSEIFAVLSDPSHLTPDGAATNVTLTYDWSGTTQQFRDFVGSMPPFGMDYIEASLASLDRAVTR